jgi:hypothetical protein
LPRSRLRCPVSALLSRNQLSLDIIICNDYESENVYRLDQVGFVVDDSNDRGNEKSSRELLDNVMPRVQPELMPCARPVATPRAILLGLWHREIPCTQTTIRCSYRRMP